MILQELLQSVLVLIAIAAVQSSNLIHRRFEYKYSFKPPYLAQKDGSVPFWTYGGNAIASNEMVRLAPSLKSQKGAIWTKQPTNFDWWEVDIVFRISGRGRIGADGLTFWYTTQQGDYNGEVFGASDRWNGLALMFDSFDNDNKHNNPYIMALLNDGTKSYDHQNDGISQMLAGCLKDFRNKPFPTRARVEYFKNTLTVLFHNGMTNNDHDYEMCLRAENVHLPKNGFFGISAATGGLADDHDVYHFLTTSLHDQLAENMQKLTGEDAEKLTKEYQEYQQKLEKQKQDYLKEHPEKQKDDFEEWFESDNQRELRQIWQAQSTTNDALRDLSRKLDEVIGRQERTLGLLSVGSGAVQQPPHQPGQAPPPPAAGGGIHPNDIAQLFQNQNVIIQLAREISTLVQDVNGKAAALLTKGTATVQAGGYDQHSLVSEMRNGLNDLKNHIAVNFGARPQGQVACPDNRCVSLTIFLVVIISHLITILAYTWYRDSREAQAKKFY